MAFLFPRLFPVSVMLVVIGVAAASALVPYGRTGQETGIAAAAQFEPGGTAGVGPNGVEEPAGAARDSDDEAAPMPQGSDRGRILVDNYGNTTSASTGAIFDDAQGFTTGDGWYRLTGVELASTNAADEAEVSVFISEPDGSGQPGTTLYTLDAPSNLVGRPFFTAPEDALLDPNTSYLVRIDVTAGSVSWEFTTDKTETEQGLSGWSFEDQFWVSSGPVQGIDWSADPSKVFALTIWGKEREDDFGEDSFSTGYLAFSRYTGESPTVQGLINDASDKDWFNTSLDFDYGGRYRIDVMPVSLTNDDDIGVRAFYLNNPHLNSGVVDVEVESVTDPPEGYVSWHFEAGRNYGPFIEVYADNGTVGEYAIRVVYDPDRIWTGTEVVRGDLYHDDTTWATITVDDTESDMGVYHYYEDHDWFAVELEEDSNYLFQAIAAGAYSSYIQPAIRLYDSGGLELESDHISHGDETSTSVSIVYRVDTGEDGTYYIDVTNAVMWDDPDKMENVGITEPIEIFSPFLNTRYFVLASSIGGRRSIRGVPRNVHPRILNRSSATFVENTAVQEFIKATDSDGQDSVTGYEITGGVDEGLFTISSEGVLELQFIPDFEAPVDENRDNVYEVQVRVTSGAGDRELSDTVDFRITITDDDTEPETVLVSNIGQKVKGKATVNNGDSAIRISTGANSEGYVIHSVALEFAEALADPSGVKVSLWSNHRPGRWDRPKAEIFAFTNPTSIEERLTEFTAPADTAVEADTSYWIMIERTGDTAIRFAKTASDSEDSISEAGWNIGSLRFHRPRSIEGKWGYRRVNDDKDQLMLRVIGYEKSGE